MKQYLHKIGAISMALLLLFSTVSFSVDMHFCGGDLVDLGFFEKEAKCGMILPDAPNGECLMSFMDCCSDQELVQEGLDELLVSVENLTPEQQKFIVTFISVFTFSNFNSPRKIIPLKDYSPPLLTHDFQVVNATFII